MSQRNPDWAISINESFNLFQLTPQFYRSEQMQKNDLAVIKQLGVKTIVSLRAFHDDEKLLENSGIITKRIRIYTWRIKDKDVIAALREIRQAERLGAVLLHCQHGADRTGLVSAMYRMVFQNWDRDKAIQELTEGGYGYHSMWKNILKYLERVGIQDIREQVNTEKA